MSLYTPSLMSAGRRVTIISPDGTHRIPPELQAAYAAIVLLDPDPPELAVWVKRLEVALGVTDAHRRALARAELLTFPGEEQDRGHSLAQLPYDQARAREIGVNEGGRRVAEVRAGDASLDWYLVRAATRREHVAEASLIDAGLAVYLPRSIGKRRIHQKREQVERSLFPGYMFVGLWPEDQALMDVEGCDGVHAVVRFGRLRDPSPISFSVIRHILQSEIDGEFDSARADRRLDPPEGTEINLIGGKLQGFPAKFVKRRDDDRIEILFRMLGKWSPHVVDPEDIGGLQTGY